MGAGFNWYSVPGIVAAALCWMLFAYVLTRSPRGLLSLAALACLGAFGANLAGLSIEANATTPDDALLALHLNHWTNFFSTPSWYWLTIALLQAQSTLALQRYLRWVGYPVGLLLAALGLGLLVFVYSNWWSVFSFAVPLPAEQATVLRFRYVGPRQHIPFLAGLGVTSLVGATVNSLVGWHLTANPAQRRSLAWHAVSSVLLLIGGFILAVVRSILGDSTFAWVSFVLAALAFGLMAMNVSAHGLVLRTPVVVRDLLYFLSGLAIICVVYTALFAAVSQEYSFRLLALWVLTLVVMILSHSLFDTTRRRLDRIFFGPEVQEARSILTRVAESPALAQDVDTLLSGARSELEEASLGRFTATVDEALRRLNRPAFLSESRLLALVPRSVEAACSRRGLVNGRPPSALDRAQALRDLIIAAMERLKPAEHDQEANLTAARQYAVVYEAYVLERPNKQICLRHEISERTLNRLRHETVRLLSRELMQQEEALSLAATQGLRTPRRLS